MPYTIHHHIHIHTLTHAHPHTCTPSHMHTLTCTPSQADEEMKHEQQRRVTEDKKLDMQEQLVHEVTIALSAYSSTIGLVTFCHTPFHPLVNKIFQKSSNISPHTSIHTTPRRSTHTQKLVRTAVSYCNLVSHYTHTLSTHIICI